MLTVTQFKKIAASDHQIKMSLIFEDKSVDISRLECCIIGEVTCEDGHVRHQPLKFNGEFSAKPELIAPLSEMIKAESAKARITIKTNKEFYYVNEVNAYFQGITLVKSSPTSFRFEAERFIDLNKEQ